MYTKYMHTQTDNKKMLAKTWRNWNFNTLLMGEYKMVPHYKLVWQVLEN